MGKKQLKNRTQVTTVINKELYAQLQQMSKDTKIPISRLLDGAVEIILKQWYMDTK
jgi:hypothetical protein